MNFRFSACDFTASGAHKMVARIAAIEAAAIDVHVESISTSFWILLAFVIELAKKNVRALVMEKVVIDPGIDNDEYFFFTQAPLVEIIGCLIRQSRSIQSIRVGADIIPVDDLRCFMAIQTQVNPSLEVVLAAKNFAEESEEYGMVEEGCGCNLRLDLIKFDSKL